MNMFVSCGCQKKFDRIVFYHYEPEENGHRKSKYVMQIPKGYELEKVGAGGEKGIEDKYIYSDSSIIYITDFFNTPNEENINNQEGIKSKKLIALSEGKELILEGSNNGKFWKEIILKNGIKIGYIGVSEKRKPEFEKAIHSFRNK